jgi:glycosyltransferase involved in cell wall biosynthesis
MNKLKGTVTVFSNSPGQPTGYGIATEALVERLKRDGADVAVTSNYGHEGIKTNYKTKYGKIPLYPRVSDVYSNYAAPLNHKHFRSQHPNQPDLMITLYDVWVFKGKYEFPIASWVPIDHMPLPPLVAEWVKRENVTPLAMSKFGQRQMADKGVDSEYVPHSVDTKIFKPVEAIGKQSLSEYMGLPNDKFIVGMNAANKASGLLHRKAFGENLMAFSIFCKKYPDAVLYLHTDAISPHGWNLIALAEMLQIPKDNLLLVDPITYRYGVDQRELAGIYSFMDVLLATSYGEGFGVPTIEAQACGTPVIVSDFAASSELVGEGWLVGGQPLWDDSQKAYFNIPAVPQIVDALENAYNRGKGRSEKAIDFAKKFDHEVVWQNNWMPVLKKLLA